MKVLVFLMSFLVLFLSVKPVPGSFTLQDTTTQDCCEDHCEAPGQDEEEPVKEEDECCGDFCNPFQACCSQLAYNPINFGSLLYRVVPAEKIKFAHRNASLSSSYSSDFWQPPKNA